MSGGFEDFGLLPELVRAVQDMGWILPSDVQDEAIPLMLGGGDVMVAAETGSGKTGAFALPIIQLVHEIRRKAASGGRAVAGGAGAATTASEPAAGAAEGSSAAAVVPQPVLNTNDRSTFVAVAPDGLTCQTRHPQQWGGVRANLGVLRGRFYYEVSMRDEGICRVGWSTQAANFDLGKDAHGYGYGGTGKKAHVGKFLDFGEPFSKGDVVGCLLDRHANTVVFSKNGKVFSPAYQVPKTQGALFPAFAMKNAELCVNFGATPFAFRPPSATGLNKAAAGDVAVAVDDSVEEAAAPSKTALANAPLALIIEPSRELAKQTFEVLEQLKQHVSSPKIRNVLVMGGVDTRKAQQALRNGCDIVVATPGILTDFVRTNKLNVSCIRVFVLDEADRMCDKENLEMLMKVYQKLPKGGVGGEPRLQVCFFSATLHSPEITKLSEALCQHPTWVDLKGKDSVPETVMHLVIDVNAAADRSWEMATVPTDNVHRGDKLAGNDPLALSEGAKRLKLPMFVALVEQLKMDQCLVFCRTNVDCDNLEKYLVALGGGTRFFAGRESGKENPYSCAVLAGFRSMDERLRNLKAFHSGELRFLICTDVAARGLDIKGLPYVINMTLPDEPENYIHRIGRVGRADRMGLAMSFVSTHREKVWYHKCKNRGRGCTNTKLVDNGGCTIWYDEPALLQAVHKRLGDAHGVPHVVPEASPEAASGYRFPLPDSITAVTFGEARDAVGEDNAHVAAIAPRVKILEDLEVQTQRSFHELRLRFHR